MDELVLAPLGKMTRIRRLKEDDLPHLMNWDKDPDVSDLAGKKFTAHGKVKEWWRNLIHDRTRLTFAIVNDVGTLIGDVALEQIVWRSREAELRISIGDKRYWNRGFGTEALIDIIRIGFEGLNLERIYLRVQNDNRRAIRAYLKAGFRKVGRLVANGRLEGHPDLVLMQIERNYYGILNERA